MSRPRYRIPQPRRREAVDHSPVINAGSTIAPVRQALEDVLAEKLGTFDQDNNLMYLAGPGKFYTVHEALTASHDYVEVYNMRFKKAYPISHLKALAQKLIAHEKLEEALIQAALQELKLAQQAMASVSAEVSHTILQTLRVRNYQPA